MKSQRTLEFQVNAAVLQKKALAMSYKRWKARSEFLEDGIRHALSLPSDTPVIVLAQVLANVLDGVEAVGLKVWRGRSEATKEKNRIAAKPKRFNMGRG